MRKQVKIHYAKLTDDERIELIFCAVSRNDKAEIKRLLDLHAPQVKKDSKEDSDLSSIFNMAKDLEPWGFEDEYEHRYYDLIGFMKIVEEVWKARQSGSLPTPLPPASFEMMKMHNANHVGEDWKQKRSEDCRLCYGPREYWHYTYNRIRNQPIFSR